jgi:hypothetical protein
VELGMLLKEEPVQFVLFDWCWPGVNNDVCTNPDIKLMIWFYTSANCLIVPQGWVLESHLLSHHKLGGVTNGGFCCRIAWQVESLAIEWPGCHVVPPSSGWPDSGWSSVCTSSQMQREGFES